MNFIFITPNPSCLCEYNWLSNDCGDLKEYEKIFRIVKFWNFCIILAIDFYKYIGFL